jgi:hypothetical protein
MHLLKTILCIIYIGLFAPLFSQPVMQYDANWLNVMEDINIHGQNNERISYDKIKGSRFWKDTSQTAFLYSNKGYVCTIPVRINLATGELYFLRESKEVTLADNIITKVVFKAEKDSSVFISQVPNLLLNEKPVNGFVQVLNFGKYQLLKYTNRTVASVDSIFQGFKRYYFADVINYFLKSNDKVERFKKLNKENVLFYLPSSSAHDAWIKENNIDFKKEKDVILFLNYYNAHSPTL